FLHRRPDLFREFRLLAWLWGLFILASGLTVALGALTSLYPLHGLAAAVAAATAVVSFATVVAMWPILPRLVAIPSPRQLAASNDQLRHEVAAHELTLRDLEATGRALEVRVEERTHQAELLDSKYRRLAEDLRTALQRY